MDNCESFCGGNIVGGAWLISLFLQWPTKEKMASFTLHVNHFFPSLAKTKQHCPQRRVPRPLSRNRWLNSDLRSWLFSVGPLVCLFCLLFGWNKLAKIMNKITWCASFLISTLYTLFPPLPFSFLDYFCTWVWGTKSCSQHAWEGDEWEGQVRRATVFALC